MSSKNIFKSLLCIIFILFIAYIIFNKKISIKNNNELSLEEKGMQLMNLINVGTYSEDLKLNEVGYLVNSYYECENKILLKDVKYDYLIDFIYRKEKDNNATKIKDEVYDEVIDSKIIKDSFMNIFGSNIKFNYKDSLLNPKIMYNKSDNKYYITHDSKGVGLSNIKRKILKVESDNNNIYVYEKASFIVSNDRSNTVDIYKDHLLYDLINKDVKDSDVFKYIDKFSTFKFTFNKIDNQYYFYSVELID